GEHLRDLVTMHAKDRCLVSLLEVPAFCDQRPNLGVALDDFGPDPRQVEPDLQVTEFCFGEQPGELIGAPWPELLSLSHQLEIAGVLAHATDLARLRHPTSDKSTFLSAELADRAPAEVEIDIGHTPAHVVVDLVYERRNQVEGLLDRRVLVEQGRHLVV